MSGPLKWLAVVAVVAVAMVLLRGLISMAKGESGFTSNKLMQARVALQFIAVALLVLAVWFGGAG